MCLRDNNIKKNEYAAVIKHKDVRVPAVVLVPVLQYSSPYDFAVSFQAPLNPALGFELRATIGQP